MAKRGKAKSRTRKSRKSKSPKKQFKFSKLPTLKAKPQLRKIPAPKEDIPEVPKERRSIVAKLFTRRSKVKFGAVESKHKTQIKLEGLPQLPILTTKNLRDKPKEVLKVFHPKESPIKTKVLDLAKPKKTTHKESLFSKLFKRYNSPERAEKAKHKLIDKAAEREIKESNLRKVRDQAQKDKEEREQQLEFDRLQKENEKKIELEHKATDKSEKEKEKQLAVEKKEQEKIEQRRHKELDKQRKQEEKLQTERQRELEKQQKKEDELQRKKLEQEEKLRKESEIEGAKKREEELKKEVPEEISLPTLNATQTSTEEKSGEFAKAIKEPTPEPASIHESWDEFESPIKVAEPDFLKDIDKEVKHLKVEPELALWLNDGREVRTVKELTKAVETMKGSVYLQHKQAGDVVHWVRDVLGNKALATELNKARNKREAITALKHHKKAEYVDEVETERKEEISEAIKTVQESEAPAFEMPQMPIDPNEETEAKLDQREQAVDEEETRLNRRRIELANERYELIKQRGELEKKKFDSFIKAHESIGKQPSSTPGLPDLELEPDFTKEKIQQMLDEARRALHTGESHTSRRLIAEIKKALNLAHLTYEESKFFEYEALEIETDVKLASLV